VGRPEYSKEYSHPKAHTHTALEKLFKEFPLSEKDTNRLKD
jgi:hypothetical protein